MKYEAMKYFLSVGIYHIDAVVFVVGWGPYLDVCDSEKHFPVFFLWNGICGGSYIKALWINIKHGSLSQAMLLLLKAFGVAQNDR